MKPTRQAAEEASKVLDLLSAVSVELNCHCDAPPQTLVLSAAKVQETCARIDDAVSALKEILAIAVRNGQGPVSSLGKQRSGESANE